MGPHRAGVWLPPLNPREIHPRFLPMTGTQRMALHLWGPLGASGLGYNDHRGCGPPPPGSRLGLCSHFSWEKPQEWKGWVPWQLNVYLCKK